MRRSRSERAAASGKKSGSKGGEEKKVVGKTKTEGKQASQLSDPQLRKVINRLNMEQQYANLTKQPPSLAKKTTKFMSEIAMNVAKQQITNLANEATTKKVASLMNRNVPKLPTKKLTALPDLATRFQG